MHAARARRPCIPAADICPATIWGEQDSTCYAYGPSNGNCNADGICANNGCTQKGAILMSCPKCQRLTHPCVVDDPAANVTVDSFCQTEGVTKDCRPVCTNDGTNAHTDLYACDGTGACQLQGQQPCGGYVCNAIADGCLGTCAGPGDCVRGYACQDGVCYAP